MERKRTWSRLIFNEEEDEEEDEEEEEEEEEEEKDRSISLRNRKRVRYTEDDDDDEEEEEEEEDDEEDEEDNEQPGPSTQKTHNQRAQENRLLSVTCGNKTGILDVENLDRGKACIKCEDRWFTPPAFEDFGGKGSSKKWKTSVLHENKPLQFWFEQGSLTTTGYKKRGTETIKQKKILSSNRISESPSEESEIQSAEETEEDDVKDEDWLPGSEELVLETEEGEEERAGAENGGEVVDSESKEEEDEIENGEMEDEDMPAVADNDKDSSVFEEREANLIISTHEKNALQKTVKVVIKRLQFQAKSDCQSNCMKHPVEDGWGNPLDEDAQNEEERKHNGSSITAATHFDPSQTSDPPIVGGVEEENGEEFTQSNERKEDREIKPETGNSPTLISAPATSPPDIKPEILNKTEVIGSTSNHTANLSTSPLLLVTVTSSVGDMTDDWEEKEETGHCGEKEKERKSTEMGPEMQRRWTKGFEDCEDANNEHLDMSKSEAGGQPFATGNITISPIQRGIEEESIEAKSGGSPTVLVEYKYEHTDATTSGHDAAELQVMKVETRVPLTTQASDGTQGPDMVEGPSSGPSNLDTMDLDQLRREKIKMQLKVLKLQEEYYTQKMKEHKK